MHPLPTFEADADPAAIAHAVTSRGCAIVRNLAPPALLASISVLDPLSSPCRPSPCDPAARFVSPDAACAARSPAPRQRLSDTR